MLEGARIIAERRISVLNFPEGGRSAAGLREFKEGPAYIAIKAGVPLVPVAIVGMRELLPMGAIHIRSGEVVLRVGDPIATEDLAAGDRLERLVGVEMFLEPGEGEFHVLSPPAKVGKSSGRKP